MKSTVKYWLVLFAFCGAASVSLNGSNNLVFIFGPQKFERSTGKPDTITNTFSLPSGVVAPFNMNLWNGISYDGTGGNDDYAVTSGTVTLNGTVVFSPSDFKKSASYLTKQVSLNSTNTLQVTLKSKPGSFIYLGITGTNGSTIDTTKPQLTITSPSNGTITKNTTITVSGTATDQSAVTLTVNNTAVSVSNGSFSTSVSLVEGTNTITVVATDAYGNQTSQSITVMKDSTPPTLTVTQPTDGMITNGTSIAVSGAVVDSTAVTVTVNGNGVPVTNGNFNTTYTLTYGLNTLTIVATDAAGNSATVTRTVRLETISPTLTISSPQDSLITSKAQIQISGVVSDSLTVTVQVNGSSVPITNGSFSTMYSLSEGMNTITVVATDAAGNKSTISRTVRMYTIPPSVLVVSPSDNLITKDTVVTVWGTVTDSTNVTVTVNGVVVTVDPDTFRTTVSLVEGLNTITIVATDAAGNMTTVTRIITRDTTPPTLTVSSPADSIVTNQNIVQITGTVSDSTSTMLTVNGKSVSVTSGSFSVIDTLFEGFDALTIVANDAAGNTTTLSRTIRLYTIPPVITVQSPQNGFMTDDSSITVSGKIVDSTNVTLTVNGASMPVNADGSFSFALSLSVGPNEFVVSVTDAAGNTVSTSFSVSRSGIILPPDPVTVASKIDPTVVTTVGAATKFLYTGTNPIQTGVDTSMMSYVRAAVIRGRVLTRDNQPLPGVAVSILNHPEFGQTLSRADGMYDMAINGGGQLTVNLAMNGYLTAQRQVNAPWQSYAHVEDVVLVQLDPQVTVVKFGDSISVARGSIVTDQDGTRQATLIFKPGTQATMKIVAYANQGIKTCSGIQILKVPSDTETVPLDSLSVRVTEYTAGTNGPEAMPAALPPTSAYTYCVELSSDEAIDSGASTVEFSKPVSYYVDNYLKFPVGTIVPVGYYDKSKGEWIASKNGLVIGILDTAGGRASLDINGDGVAESSTTLDSLGVDSLELQKLASLYRPGKTLWQVPIRHFTPLDCNCEVTYENVSGASNTEDFDGSNAKNTDCSTIASSIIGIRDQSLGESQSIAGTPFSMYYNSNNAPGFRQADMLKLPLTGDTLPQGITGVDLKVDIAGQEFTRHFDPSPDLNYRFVWNGKDAYGRVLQGEQPVSVQVGYDYTLPRNYRVLRFTSSYAMDMYYDFGQILPSDLIYYLTDTIQTTSWRSWNSTIGTAFNASLQGLGGWTLDAHHVYDPNGEKIYFGNGEVRDVARIASNTTDVDGTLGDGYSWMAVAPDGVMYFSRSKDAQVWKRCTDGSIVLVAGSGDDGYGGDGGPATEAALSGPSGLALGPDGSLYIADSWNACIRRVDPFGIITTYAGTGTEGFSGDYGPAVAAKLSSPTGIAIGPDGSLFIADADSNRIRMVNPAGIITTVAGTGTAGYSGDGGSSLNADLNYPTGVDIDDQGNIYVADRDNLVVRKITPQGVITTIAGTGDWDYSGPNGDGGPAISASLWLPQSVTVGKEGTVYVDEAGDVRKIGADGIITTLATSLYNGFVNASAIDPDGTFYYSESGWCCSDLFLRKYPQLFASASPQYDFSCGCGITVIHQVKPAFPGVSESETSIASEDGSEVYVFDMYGKHLRTLDALTGVRLYSFSYDSLGLLTAVVDRDSLVTTVQRSVDGTPLAIISPYGQRSLLKVDTVGNLISVIDPARDTTRFTYTDGGLMTSLRDARGHTHTFAYDSLGRLAMDQDPAGGYKILTREDKRHGFAVTLSTALGDKSVYAVERLPDGTQVMTKTDASGLTDTTTYSLTGTWTTISHDGTWTQTIQGPDPRFGMQSPVIVERDVETPSGVYSQTQESRTISEMNGLQIGQFTDIVSVNWRVYQTVYDGTQHLFSTLSPQARQSFTYVDTLGRVIKDSIPGIVPVNYFYDGKGRLTSAAQGTRISYFNYDSLGRIALAKDPIGNTSGFAYDSVGRVTTQVLPDGRVITFTYDANGNLITLTPPGRPEHIFDYNVNDLTDKYMPPFAGDSSRVTNYFYDLDKRLAMANLPDGRNITITYDTAGCGCGGTADRIRSIGYDRGTETFAYDSVGNLKQTISPTGDTLLYVYDGFLPYTTYSSGTVNGSVHYYIDGDFWLDALQLDYTGTDSLHNIIGYDYDEDGLLTGVYQPTDAWWNTDDAHYLTLTRDFQTGNITGTSLGNVNTSQGYDGYGALSSYEADYGPTPMLQTTYLRDSLGRITEIFENEESSIQKRDYGYDAVGRLVKVITNDTMTSIYSYDANGNRIAHITPTEIDSGTYDAQDRMLSYAGTQYLYTRNGDLQTKVSGTDTTKYTYDAFGNLTQVVMPPKGQANGDVIQYVIDGQNRRIAKKVNGRIVDKWLYAGQLSPVAELDSADNLLARFSGAYMNKRDTIYQIVRDHLGSVRLVVNVSTGIVAQRINYDEFGNVLYDSNPGFQPFGFAGGLYDPDTKLVRFGARDYDASMGRWTKKDPLRFEGRDNNFYSYVEADPINYFDFDGLKLWYADKQARKQFYQNIKEMMKSPKGRELLKFLNDQDAIYKIHSGKDPRTGKPADENRNDVYVDPNYHPMINTDCGDKPASTTRVLAHELGHLTGIKDSGPNNMDNVNAWENPIMFPLDGCNRTNYDYVPSLPEVIVTPK